MTTERTDAWLAELGEEDRWKVYDKHATSKSWEACAAWACEEYGMYGVQMPTRSSYYRFRQRMAERESEHRIELAITEKARIGREMSQIGDLNPALIQAFQQRALESELRGDSNGAEKWLTLALDLGAGMAKKVELDLKKQAQQRMERQLGLAREKFEAAEARLDAARAAMARLDAAGGLSPEARAEIEKAMGIL